ncbi:MAG: cobyrinate a,c-diamide synthase [Betaproteobacteria bacterium]|nr:cobyrinate a,c-diamide synthase [Betaproteobacteria bacterium]
MPYVYLSAAHKSSGKTTLTLGLARALKQRGHSVQVFKKGPDYIDPIWHAQASGRPCYNLDFRLMQHAEIDQLFARHASGADISLIEGNKGLYDGMDLEGSDSNAALAKQLKAPVVLVLDCQGTTRGIAPLLMGYQAFDPEVNFAGVILNKVAGPRHEDKLRGSIERYTDLKIIGSLPRQRELEIVERHLGLIPGNEAHEAEAKIEAIAAQVAEHVDLDAFEAIARQASAPTAPAATPHSQATPIRIGILRDRAFGFYYQEDLDALAAENVELVTIDALHDKRLPEVAGLIIGGGFPEVFLDELSANAGLRGDIRRAAEAGLPIYAECGGLMYLAQAVRWQGHSAEMVGLLPGVAVMGDRPVGRGYAEVRGTGQGPFAPAADSLLPAHEFHYSHLEDIAPVPIYAYDVTRGHGIDGRHDGIVYKNVLASYCHFRGAGPNGWIKRFVEHARRIARNNPAAHAA